MNCNVCGAQLAEGAAFCTNCGNAVAANNAQQQQPNFQQPNYQQPNFQQPNAPVPGKGLGVASLVLGIISLVLFCIWYIAIPCGIIGIILGAASKSQAKKVGAPSGLATAGLVCSIISIAITLIIAAIGTAFLAELGLL